MLKRLIALLLTACGGGENIENAHDVVACGSSWGQIERCEFACVDRPGNELQCSILELLGMPFQCDRVVNYDGVDGCCFWENGVDRVEFFECKTPPELKP